MDLTHRFSQFLCCPALLFLQPTGPIHQLLEQLADQLLRGFVSQLSILIEMFVSISKHDLRLVDGIHVQKDKRLPQMILRASGTDSAD